MSDTYKFKHHTIAIPQLTPADQILEAAKQLDSAISQQPTKAPMDELTAIELLREVLLEEKNATTPFQQYPTPQDRIIRCGTRTHSGAATRTCHTHAGIRSSNHAYPQKRCSIVPTKRQRARLHLR